MAEPAAELELRVTLLPGLVLCAELLRDEPPPELKVWPLPERKLWLPVEEVRLEPNPELREEELWEE